MKTVRLALDWTPNTNHIGFYVGLAKGWYQEKGIDLQILAPSEKFENKETPDARLARGEVDLGIANTEALIQLWMNSPDKLRPLAIATIFEDCSSALIARKSSRVSTLKDLDGKKYASYEWPNESAIVRHMIKDVGGEGNIEVVTPPKLHCFDAVADGDADFTWIYLAWEGIMARKSSDMISFPINECGYPYGYSTLIIANPNFLDDEVIVRDFLEVTNRSFVYAFSNPKESVDLFIPVANHPSLASLGVDFIHESMQCAIEDNHLIDPESKRWGVIKSSKLDVFMNWMFKHKILQKHDNSPACEGDVPINKMYTNKYLPDSHL